MVDALLSTTFGISVFEESCKAVVLKPLDEQVELRIARWPFVQAIGKTIYDLVPEGWMAARTFLFHEHESSNTRKHDLGDMQLQRQEMLWPGGFV
jgi:hypothetical protein